MARVLSVRRIRGSRYKVGSRKKTVTRPSRYKGGKYGALVNFPSVARAMMRRSTTRLPRSIRPFPDFKILRHKYCTRITLPATNQSQTFNSVYVFRANSLYDPDFTGTGHQPMFYDETSVHYGKYTVVASKIKVIVPCADTRARNMGIFVTDKSNEITAATPVDQDGIHEQYSHTAGIIASTRNKKLELGCKYRATKEFKTTFAGLMADDGQAVSIGTNPSTPCDRYFIIWSTPFVDGDTLPNMYVNVEMTFTTVWRHAQYNPPS